MADKIGLPSLDTLKINDFFEQKPFEIGKLPPFVLADSPAPPMLIVRREDFLVLSFSFSGLVIKGKGTTNPTLVRSGEKGAFIFVLFPQQSIAEQAFYNAAGGAAVDPPLVDPASLPENDPLEFDFPAAARLSGFSWFSFKIPDNITSIPFTLEALLAWEGWKFLAPPPNGLPTPTLTSAIEAPYRLLLSPEHLAIWQNAVAPINHQGAVELWHTRLKRPAPGPNEPSAVPLPAKVRAAWARDLDLISKPGQTLFPSDFRSSLSSAQRTELVLLSSTARKDFQPQPVLANKLMLSSLGAFLDLHGLWDGDYRAQLKNVLQSLGVPRGLSISEWRHLATLGRDHYVRVVQEGALFPFGHRAALVTITQRNFIALDKGTRKPVVAPLLQQMFVVVREPSKKMTEVGTVASGELINSLLPFKWVHISNLSTPTIELPTNSQINLLGETAFWIRANNEDFKFKLIGEDWEDHACEFRVPLIFVSDTIKPAEMKQVVDVYNNASLGRRQAETFGRLVAFAPTEKGGDTSFESQSLTFDVRSTKSSDTEPFRPALLQALVRIGAVEQMVGTAAAVEIKYPPAYLTAGIKGTSNAGEVFAQLVGKSPALSFSGQAQKSGGVVTPNFTVHGLSRRFGVVGGNAGHASSTAVNALAKGGFNPSDYFDLGAKLLGGISLADIIAPVFGDAEVPTLQRTPIFEGGEKPVAIETTLAWTPQLKDHSILQFRSPQKPGDPKGLSLTVKLLTSLQGGESKASINCVMGSFSLVFFDVIEIQFTSLTFDQQAGQKLDVGAKLPKSCLKFGGPLAFLNPIAELIDSAGFDDPPSVEVDASGARVGYSLGLPPLTIGAYAVQNITLGAALNIPFTGEAIRVRFNFCERQSPFLLTISGVAGGGFCGIALGADGIESIEASLEFGGNLALNFGVASGSVCVMGGFYFSSDNDLLTFTAYVRAAGIVEVLSLISISTEFYLGLSYSKAGESNRFWGQATVTVAVEVAFFSQSVSITMEREFAGGNNDPTFQQLTSREQYKAYREAFAA